MIADKVVLTEAIIDREVHSRLKKKTGINVFSGADLVRAVVMLLNMNDTQKENVKAFREAYEAEKEKNENVLARMKEEAATFAKMEKPDNVNHPAHYKQGGIECIDAIRASMSADEFAGFLKGNAVKYLWRYRHKGKAAEDLKKARWYIDRLIEHTEREKE